MQGLSFQSLKKHKAIEPVIKRVSHNFSRQHLIPLYVCTLMGASGAVFYILRLATRSPDVSWNRKTNPEPWEEYRNKQYKFYSPIRDYSKTDCPAPKY